MFFYKKVLQLFVLIVACSSLYASPYTDHRTLPVGSKAPDFNLKGVDNKMYSLSSFSNAKILVIIFTCNHCPTAQAYEKRIIQLTNDYRDKGVAVVAVNPNNPDAITPNELDFSDLSDSYREMKIRAKERHFNFPYLYDGDKQSMAQAYGPVATPHVFIFDKDRILRYEGRIDDEENQQKTPHVSDARNAIEELLNNREVTVSTTKVFGCSVKWIEKKKLVEKAKHDWANEPVTLDTINEDGLRELVKNSGNKLRLINVWATWCGPCVEEFPDLVTINRMYRPRDFEFISISADAPDKKDRVINFLKSNEASSKNYIYSGDNKYSLIESVNHDWKGSLPYTMLVEPGGKIVYAKEGPVDIPELKKVIVENHLIGRFAE